MSRRLRSMLLALVACALAAGAWAVWGSARMLDGTSWRLTGWSESSLRAGDFQITARFTHGTIGGHSAVNSYSGPYTARRSGAFRVGALASTEMAGEEPAMRAEATYLRLLVRARSFTRTGATLTLRDASGSRLLVFAAR